MHVDLAGRAGHRSGELPAADLCHITGPDLDREHGGFLVLGGLLRVLGCLSLIGQGWGCQGENDDQERDEPHDSTFLMGPSHRSVLEILE